MTSSILEFITKIEFCTPIALVVAITASIVLHIVEIGVNNNWIKTVIDEKVLYDSLNESGFKFQSSEVKADIERRIHSACYSRETISFAFHNFKLTIAMALLDVWVIAGSLTESSNWLDALEKIEWPLSLSVYSLVIACLIDLVWIVIKFKVLPVFKEAVYHIFHKLMNCTLNK